MNYTNQSDSPCNIHSNQDDAYSSCTKSAAPGTAWFSLGTVGRYQKRRQEMNHLKEEGRWESGKLQQMPQKWKLLKKEANNEYKKGKRQKSKNGTQ
jgi:hypothetical protein